MGVVGSSSVVESSLLITVVGGRGGGLVVLMAVGRVCCPFHESTFKRGKVSYTSK